MWMKIDDGLHAHRKTRAVTKSHPEKRRDAAPMGLWVLAGSWAGQNGTDGWVPEDELDRWDDDWAALVARLVRSNYWWPQERNGEQGYGFTDWHDYNDPADLASKRGTYGNHVRWHVNEKRVDPECEHCPKEPDDRGDIAPESGGDRGAISGPESGGESRFGSGAIALPEPDPNPTRPDPNPVASTIAERRDDVSRLCEHLADRIAANGSKRPVVTQRWRDAARLMLDRDERTESEIHGAIEWSQADEFWRSNVLSMPTLREKYDQLRLQAQRRPGSSTSRTEEWKAMQERQMARAEAREREMGLR
jgi:hypothetical protein